MSSTIDPEAVPGKVCSGFPSRLVKNKELERFRENALETRNSSRGNAKGVRRIMRKVTVAATQMACVWDEKDNVARAERLVREAKARGADLVLIQELFAAPYFCQDQFHGFFDLARPFADNPLIAHFSGLARELGMVLPVSYVERAGQSYFNSLAVIDADGTVLGNYRKSHLPDGPGYTEKFYFSPGDTGYRITFCPQLCVIR